MNKFIIQAQNVVNARLLYLLSGLKFFLCSFNLVKHHTTKEVFCKSWSFWRRKITSFLFSKSSFVTFCHLQDRFTGGYSEPLADLYQDYNLTGFNESNGKTFLEFYRKRDTGDKKDIEIKVRMNLLILCKSIFSILFIINFLIFYIDILPLSNLGFIM